MTDFNRNLFEQWLTALRSGEYQQTRGMLKDYLEHEFCCLGVACDLYDSNLWDDKGFYTFVNEYGDIEASDTELPCWLSDELGLEKKIAVSIIRDGNVVTDDTRDIESILIQLNDGGYSFNFIASVAGYLVEQTQKAD